MIERRFAKRFRAVDGALAALSPESGRVGQIRNISANGLAFQYIADDAPEADLHGTVNVQIMFAGEGVWLESIPVKWVADIDISTNASFSRLPIRQTCLQFTTLTDTQRKRLQEFIHRYTRGDHRSLADTIVLPASNRLSKTPFQLQSKAEEPIGR